MNSGGIRCPGSQYSQDPGKLQSSWPSKAAGCYKMRAKYLKQFFTFAESLESQTPTAAPTERQVMQRGKAARFWEAGSFQQWTSLAPLPPSELQESSVSPACWLHFAPSLSLVWFPSHLHLPLTPEKSPACLSAQRCGGLEGILEGQVQHHM